MSLTGNNPSVSTDKIYTLHTSYILWEFQVGAGNAAVMEIRAAPQPGVTSPYTVAAGFTITALAKLRMYQTFTPPPDSLAYFEIDYSPTQHRWFRFREAAGTTYWDTSPDGVTWTNQLQRNSYAAYLEPVSFNIDMTGTPVAAPVTTGVAVGGFSHPLEQVQGTTGTWLDNQLTDITNLGAGWQRGDYPVSLVSPTSGTFTYTAADLWITKALAAGVKPLPVIYQLPTWMNGSANDKTPPQSDDTFASWCATACAHLYSIGVRFVEIWNEQNLAGFWNNGAATDVNYAQRYTQMMSRVYPAIKAAVPQMRVILGGISTSDTVYGGSVNGAYNTLVRYADLGTYNYCDAVAWHPYVEDDQPCDNVDLYPMMGPDAVNAVLAQMDRVKPGMQLWTTETGRSTWFPGGTGTEALKSTTAQALYNALLPGGCLASVITRMGPVFWFCVRNRNIGDPREDSFGFVSNNGVTHYAAYTPMQTLWAQAWPGAGGGGTTTQSYLDNVNHPAALIPGGFSFGLGSARGDLTLLHQDHVNFLLEFWDTHTNTWKADPDCDIRAISLDRGRARYLDPTAAGQISVTIANFEGRWSGWNAGAFWAQLGSSPTRFTAIPTRLRLATVALFDDGTVALTGPYTTMFTGTLDSIVDAWPNTTDAIVTITATDGFKDLARYSAVAGGTPTTAGAKTGTVIGAIATKAAWPTAASGWLPVPRRIDTGQVGLQAWDLQGVALDTMQTATESEWGWLFMDVDGALTFYDRNAVINKPRMSTVQWTFVDADHFAQGGTHVCYEDISVRIDSDTIINLAQITPVGGTLVTSTDAASVTAYGPKTYSRTDLPINTGTEAQATADLIITEYAHDEKRVESLVFEAAYDRPQHVQVAAGLQLNDKIRVFRQFLSGNGAVPSYTLQADLLVMGIHHDIVAGGAEPGGGGYTAIQSWKVTIRTATAINIAAWGQWDVDVWDHDLSANITEWSP
jgi:hypothetical protein